MRELAVISQLPVKRSAILLLAAVFAAGLAPMTARGAAGYLYESDFSTGTIFQFTNPPTPGATPKKITFRTGVDEVRGLAFDRSGNLFVGQSEKIVKITPGGSRSVFADGVDGPKFLAADAAENLFASDRDGHVLKFTPAGAKSVFASGLDKPAGLAFDVFGNLFVADSRLNAIYKFTPSGTRSTFAEGLNNPHGLAFDRSGNLYVANPGTKSVEAFTPLGSRFTSVFNINSPVGLAFDTAGNLFVADSCDNTGTNSIQKFTPTAETGTFFASGLGCPLQLAFEPARDPLLNISTRARVETGPNQELIGGFIITGSTAKTLLIRGIGPSLAKSGIAQPLQDPTLELHTPEGIRSNDNWMEADKTEIQSTGLAPSDARESAILASLNPGAYTAILRGHPEMPTGVALVEVYDLDPGADSTLGNISTRGFVQFADNVMIGGFILAGANGAGKVIVRALGPSLSDAGVTGVLRDPTLSLRDVNGTQIAFNDDWGDDQAFEIYATGLPPSNSLEAAIVATLPSGQYTAVVQGVNAQSGVGLIEVYNLR